MIPKLPGQTPLSSVGPMEWDPTRPKWRQIAELILERIDSGYYGPHSLIQEVRLAQELEVNRRTVRKAIAHLRSLGILTTEPGMGSSIAKRNSDETDQ